MDLGLKGRQALITGAAKGIGKAIAERLAAEGCNLILVGRGKDTLNALARDLEKTGACKAMAVEADLSDSEKIESLSQENPAVDIVVNNAGAVPGGTIYDLDFATWRKAWDGKIFGYVGVMRAYLRRMEERGSGVILNIIGAAGERPNAEYAAGAAGNAALMALTRALGAKSPSSGVRVVGINPGPILTERLKVFLQSRAKLQFGDPEKWPSLLESLPFGRAGKPEEVAAMAALLVSDLSGYTSGTIITIDGGLTARGQAY
jgi:3-oxoacyl-[acyl-carrier protein] reductase